MWYWGPLLSFQFQINVARRSPISIYGIIYQNYSGPTEHQNYFQLDSKRKLMILYDNTMIRENTQILVIDCWQVHYYCCIYTHVNVWPQNFITITYLYTVFVLYNYRYWQHHMFVGEAKIILNHWTPIKNNSKITPLLPLFFFYNQHHSSGIGGGGEGQSVIVLS